MMLLVCTMKSVGFHPVGNVLQPGAGAVMARIAQFMRSDDVQYKFILICR